MPKPKPLALTPAQIARKIMRLHERVSCSPTLNFFCGDVVTDLAYAHGVKIQSDAARTPAQLVSEIKQLTRFLADWSKREPGDESEAANQLAHRMLAGFDNGFTGPLIGHTHEVPDIGGKLVLWPNSPALGGLPGFDSEPA